MAKAVWKGVTIAESDDVVLVEGAVYFPRKDVDWGYVQISDEIEPTYCHWKGMAEYYDIFVQGETNKGAAWCYPQPYPEAAAIERRVAFWKGVEIEGAPAGEGLVEPAATDRGERTGWQALCWYLRAAEKPMLTAEDIAAGAGVAEDELAELWHHPDVRRYAERYKWKLTLRLERTE